MSGTFLMILAVGAVMMIIAVICGFCMALGKFITFIGFRIKDNEKFKNKKLPEIIIGTGTFVMLLPKIAAIILLINVTVTMAVYKITGKGSPNLLELLHIENLVIKKDDDNDALKMLKTADKGDFETFKKAFPEDIANDPDFEKAAENFFEIYPKGFSKYKWSLCGFLDGNEGKDTAVFKYIARTDEKKYYVIIKYRLNTENSSQEKEITFFGIADETTVKPLNEYRKGYLSCNLS